MKKVFLSFSFRDEDRPLVSAVEQLLSSHELMSVTGKKLGGGPLTPTVMHRIEECDALIALLTRRDEKAIGGWTTHDWVRDELIQVGGLRRHPFARVTGVWEIRARGGPGRPTRLGLRMGGGDADAGRDRHAGVGGDGRRRLVGGHPRAGR